MTAFHLMLWFFLPYLLQDLTLFKPYLKERVGESSGLKKKMGSDDNAMKLFHPLHVSVCLKHPFSPLP